MNLARHFLADWFDRLSASGFDGSVFLDALADDLVWTATGQSPVSGTFHGRQQYIDNVWTPLDQHLARWPRAEVVRILGDGDWATVQFRGVGGLGVNGSDYTLDYCWIVHVENDRITEVIGFYDQTKVNELFAPTPHQPS
ncbi:ketosteroid isomerase-like protein [Dietzia sp. 2505]|uniref:nuclear transport factor 2 family protein n=1 Tax=Dietzia sp. 2505 TaxID=3156457 RepID=UPI003397F9B1